jgi:hypothetical protein
MCVDVLQALAGDAYGFGNPGPVISLPGARGDAPQGKNGLNREKNVGHLHPLVKSPGRFSE